mmetsp:Transcript_12772/g.28281  ORF Transcript_12772/g.28281 Transcript_12772/m.28281 type:complete len:85 (-) Transcript_12772:1493-1747(-)
MAACPKCQARGPIATYIVDLLRQMEKARLHCSASRNTMCERGVQTTNHKGTETEGSRTQKMWNTVWNQAGSEPGLAWLRILSGA